MTNFEQVTESVENNYVPCNVSFNWETCQHHDSYLAEVETGAYRDWVLDTPYFKGE